MRTKMSIDIILLVVTPVAYIAISANERTFAPGQGAGRGNRSGRLSVGWGGVCRYSWRVPKGFRGKFRVQVDIDLGPFEVKQDETLHLI